MVCIVKRGFPEKRVRVRAVPVSCAAALFPRADSKGANLKG